MSAVTDSFQELSALVKSKGFNHDLDLKTFCDACSHVSVSFGCLGIASIIRASLLLDNETRVLEVSFFSSIGCCFRIIYSLFSFCWRQNFLCALQVSLVKVQVESNFIVNNKLSVEGPLRMRKEYNEGIVESPKIKEESIPQQLKGAFDQANSTMQQLSVSIRDAAMSGFKVPLGGTFQRLFLISYLDDEILNIYCDEKCFILGNT